MYTPKHKEVLDLMVDAYDMHTHTAPDFFERSLNDEELLHHADKYGMAGVMLKNHLAPTPARAHLANMLGKHKVKAYGSAALNLTAGGINPIAVQYYLQSGAKVIWMPTIHARNQMEYFGRIKGVKECLELIKQDDAMVATGHISAGESIAVCKAARKLGIKTVLTHSDWTCTTIPIDVQKAMVDIGVTVEKLWFDVGMNYVTADYMAQTIHDLGVQNVYIATDRGQTHAEYPCEAMMMFMDALLDWGFSDDDIYCMTHIVPKRMLGIE